MQFEHREKNAKECGEDLRKAVQGRRAVRFIDLFAGIGGMRKGFEQACESFGLASRCVFTSEIKPHAIEVLGQNHPGERVHGDITAVDADDVPDFDFLLGGFPCQAFSAAGKRLGFEDTRGRSSSKSRESLSANGRSASFLRTWKDWSTTTGRMASRRTGGRSA